MLLVVVALGTTPACDHAPARPEPDVTVELKDFEVGLSTARTESGRVVFDLENTGPTVHELVVARTDLASGELPLGSDGLSVDEDTPKVRVLGEDESVQLDERHQLDLDLDPGHYVLFCNLEGHYLGGMHVDLEVQP
ncbi:MAG: hypothetical protein R2746_07060 [Acidimicrobiales bacterium]|nr:hypothetical protein [Actinomycetota bacterium]